jgi:hypothetical protein
VLGEGGIRRRRLPAQRGGDSEPARGVDDLADRVEDCGVGLVEQLGADVGITIHPSINWVRSLLPMDTPSMPIST